MGEADDFYVTESKKNEDEFLEELKKGRRYEDVEKEYIKKSEKTRIEFEKRYAKELKNYNSNKKKKEKKKEKDKKFIIENILLEEEKKDRIKRNLSFKVFKTKRRARGFSRTIFAEFLWYIVFRCKYFFKDIKQSFNIRKDKTSKWFAALFKAMKERLNKTKEFIKSLKTKIFSKKKGKKKKKKGKKKEEEKT